MKLSKRQLKRIILEEKQKMMTENPDLDPSGFAGDLDAILAQPDVRALLTSLLDVMQTSGEPPTGWRFILDAMRAMVERGEALKAMLVFEEALIAYEFDEDPYDYER